MEAEYTESSNDICCPSSSSLEHEELEKTFYQQNFYKSHIQFSKKNKVLKWTLDNSSDLVNNLIQNYKSSNLYKNLKDEFNSANSFQIEESSTLPYVIDRVSLFRQFRIISSRTIKTIYRNPALLATHYIVSIVVALICGILFWGVTDDIAGFQNRLGIFFFLCTLFGFSCLSSMQVFASERIIFIRERANLYYDPLPYYLSKVTIIYILDFV